MKLTDQTEAHLETNYTPSFSPSPQIQSALQAGSIEDSVVNTEVYAFRMGSLLVFFRVYLDRRKLMQDYELRLLPNVNHKLIGLDSLEPRKAGEKEEEWLAKLVQNRLKHGIGQLNLIGADSLVFLTNSILVSLNYTDPILNPKDDHFVNERLLGDRVLGSRSDLDTAERALNSLMNLNNLNSVYGHKNKTLRGRINLATANLSDRKEHTKAVKKLNGADGGGVNSVSISSNGAIAGSSSTTSSTTTQPSTTKAVVEIFTNTPSYATTSTLKQTITMRPIIQRFTTQSSPADRFNHSSFLYSSPALNRVHTNRLDKPQLFNSLLSSSTATLSTTSSPTGNSSCLLS